MGGEHWDCTWNVEKKEYMQAQFQEKQEADFMRRQWVVAQGEIEMEKELEEENRTKT